MTFAEFRKQGFLAEICNLFSREDRARHCLVTFGFPQGRIPEFDSAEVFWTTAAQEIDGGILPEDDLRSLVQHAADQYPGNRLLGPHTVSRRSEAALEAEDTPSPEGAPAEDAEPQEAGPPEPEASVPDAPKEGCAVILGPPPEGEDTDGLQQRVAQMCAEQGEATAFEIVQVLENGQLELYFPGVHANELLPLQERLRGQGIRCRIIDDRYLDRILNRLLVEGPDQARYQFSNVPASTLVGDVARALISDEYDSNWPKDARDKPRPATVDHVDHEGNERRLRPDDRLDDSNVEDGDLLQVHPESTAGSQNPIYREEALVRAKNQVVRYARLHPGFRVQANSTHAPTEYVIHFGAPGIQPHEQGPERARHSVLLQLPEQFPSVSPAVWWQPPVIYHPNVHRGTGRVCMGVLDDRYRPGLDFGLLCQMLVDIASFHNYVVTHGYNEEACRWAASEEGQATIVAGGGRPEDPDKLAQARGHLSDELPRREPGVSPMTRIERLQS